MKLILLITMLTLSGSLMADDAFYLMEDADNFAAEIKDSHLIMKVKLKKISPPKATGISVFSTPDSPQKYCVQISLATPPKEGWLPVLSINGRVYFKGVGITISNDPRINSYLQIGSDDPKEVVALGKSLAGFLKIPPKRFIIEKTLTDKREKP